eukprot:3104474-Rhodomonas_salina.1
MWMGSSSVHERKEKVSRVDGARWKGGDGVAQDARNPQLQRLGGMRLCAELAHREGDQVFAVRARSAAHSLHERCTTVCRTVCSR